MIIWTPIDSAPKDGRPVWARGNNWGDPAKGQHRAWVHWNGEAWQAPGADGDIMGYLTDWMPKAGTF